MIHNLGYKETASNISLAIPYMSTAESTETNKIWYDTCIVPILRNKNIAEQFYTRLVFGNEHTTVLRNLKNMCEGLGFKTLRDYESAKALSVVEPMVHNIIQIFEKIKPFADSKIPVATDEVTEATPSE